MILLLILLFIIIFLFEGPSLIKKNDYKEFAAFAVLLGIAFTLALLQVIGIKIPSPMKGIQYIVENVLHLKF